MNEATIALARRILAASEGRKRFIAAIAGPPASGKSTLVEDLKRLIDREAGAGCAAIFPMDGFHFDDAVLEARGHRARKGAPFTFDVAGFAATLQRIRGDEEEVAVPIFDRSLELARAGAGIIEQRHRIVLTEGNYLLLEEAPWSGLRRLYDLSILLAVPETMLRERLMQRWLSHGKTRQQAIAWIESNDMPNIRSVLTRSGDPDITLAEPDGDAG